MKSTLALFFFSLFVLNLSGCATSPKIRSVSKVGTDFHMHIHSSSKIQNDMQYTADRALFAADSINLKRALVLSNAYSFEATQEYAKQENNFVMDQTRNSNGRLAGACAVNPKETWAIPELNRCVSLGFKVLKLHFMASGMDLRKPADYKLAQNFLKAAEKNHFTILVHTNYPQSTNPGEIEKLKTLIEEFPNIRWIVGHSFGKEFALLKEIKHPNFFVEISIAPLLTNSEQEKVEFAETVRIVGVKKFLFGSDWPVIHPAETLKALNTLPFSQEEKELIQFTNANQLNDLFL